MISETSGHRWGNAKCLVDTAEVVVHVVKSNRGRVVLNLLTEAIRQTSEATHAHSHGEILPFNVAGGHMRSIGVTTDGRLASADALGRAVAGFTRTLCAI